MPRARNIKYSFFQNDELAENEPLGRLLFVGMWTIADCYGNLEWRPKRIKTQILPYDDCDIERLAINLDKSGFIRFYSDYGKMYVNIPGFIQHQNPHKNERDKGTDIPDYSECGRQLIDFNTLTINPDKSGEDQERSDSDPADSCFLIPDSCSLNPEGDKSPGPSETVIDYLNQKTGSKFQHTKTNLGFINGRMKADKELTLNDFISVIDFKCQEWGSNDEMRQYLRPKTLFCDGNFAGYLTAAKRWEANGRERSQQGGRKILSAAERIEQANRGQGGVIIDQ